MLLFYLDEQGNGELTTASLAAHPFFSMGAMLLQDAQRLSLCDKLRRLKDNFFPDWQQSAWEESEIKGRYLAQAVRRYQRGLAPLQPSYYRNLTGGRLGTFINRLFNIIHRFNPVFYVVSVDKAELVRRYHGSPLSPVGLAYAYLQMRAALLIAENYGGDEGAIFLADEENHHESLFRKGEMKRVREALNQWVPIPANMELILDKPLWVNRGELSVEREICQLADFGLYVVGTAIKNRQWDRNDQWLTRLSPYIARHWRTGAVWDGGITIVPRPSRYPAFPF